MLRKSWIYITHKVLKYFEKSHVFSDRLKLPMLMFGSRSSTGREFQRDGPVTEKAHRSYMLSRCHGTMAVTNELMIDYPWWHAAFHRLGDSWACCWQLLQWVYTICAITVIR